jgi:L-iditol 2-dehydrogenase
MWNSPLTFSGAGPIGLATLLAARAAGAAPVVITDVVKSRLDFARTLVPGVRTVLINPAKSPQEIAAEVRTAAGLPVKIVLECTGMESSIHAATYVSHMHHVHKKNCLTRRLSRLADMSTSSAWARASRP